MQEFIFLESAVIIKALFEPILFIVITIIGIDLKHSFILGYQSDYHQIL